MKLYCTSQNKCWNWKHILLYVGVNNIETDESWLRLQKIHNARVGLFETMNVEIGNMLYITVLYVWVNNIESWLRLQKIYMAILPIKGKFIQHAAQPLGIGIVIAAERASLKRASVAAA
jgi:hypothetical protein